MAEQLAKYSKRDIGLASRSNVLAFSAHDARQPGPYDNSAAESHVRRGHDGLNLKAVWISNDSPHAIDVFALYKNETAQFPLLTTGQERSLGMTVQKGKMAQDKLSDEATSALLTAKAKQDLEKEVHDGEKAQLDLYHANLRHVISIAKGYRKFVAPSDFLDLVQEGNIGLREAARRYNPTRGTRFTTCADPWIRKEIRRYLAENYPAIPLPEHTFYAVQKARSMMGQAPYTPAGEQRLRILFSDGGMKKDMHTAVITVLKQNTDRPLFSLDKPSNTHTLPDRTGAKTDWTLADVIPDTRMLSDDDSERAAFEARFHTLVSGILNEREQTILYMRYGVGNVELDTDGQQHSFQEIADILGISRGRVWQIGIRAQEKLRENEELASWHQSFDNTSNTSSKEPVLV